ncbi:MAG: DUF423 domain-containing protein [Rhizobiales bacterium]|nr:DUF423 domain-containing protein [Hyphomicrobiales bacterium]
MMSILLVIAGLMGAAGITLSAVGTHAYPGAGLESAGQILLFHAAAIMAMVAAIDRGLLSRTFGVAGAAGLVLGSLLFAGDISLPIYAGVGLFPKAAPAGGVILIVSWIATAVAAATPPARAA